jgi:serine protease
MKKRFSIALIVFSLVWVCAQEGAVTGQIFEQNPSNVGQMFAPGEFLVKFKAGVSEQTIDALNSTHGVSTIYTSSLAGFRRLSVPGGQTVADMVQIYSADADVEYTEANYIAYAMKAPNDELYSSQWHLHDGSGGINVESAWTVSTGLGAVVAILDTGIAYEDRSEKNPAGSNRSFQQAPDLTGTSIVAGFDFVNDDEHPNDDSVCGHGTHIAGTIAQSTRNGLGTAGIAFDASLMPVKVLDRCGAGTYADIAEAIVWATDNGAHVINMGFAGAEPSMALEAALSYSYERGVTLIAAAGNDGLGHVSYPAAYDDYVVAVGATRFDETLAYYSNHGLSLDLVAPGGDLGADQNGDGYADGILQQAYQIIGEGAISWGYGLMEGTSMAAAHVSGVAALLVAGTNAASADQVRQALQSTAKDKGPEGWDTRYGWGIVDASAALQWTNPEAQPQPEPKPAPQALDAEFTAEPKTAPRNTAIQFTDQSTGNITGWLWDFGDGATSTEQNPTHAYKEAQTYTVRLTVSNADGSNTERKEAFIKLFTPQAPDADFTREPTGAGSPFTIQFTDTSSAPARILNRVDGNLFFTSIETASLGGITSWSWDFGDGTTSNERNPLHTYQQAGSYTVSLAVEGPGGSDTETKSDYIELAKPSAPIADFRAKPTSGSGPLVVQFTDLSVGPISNRSWDFGDGTTSTEQNPSHTYTFTDKADFTVSLTVTGAGGSDTQTKAEYIHLDAPPILVTISLSKNAVFQNFFTVTASVTVTQNDPKRNPVEGAVIEGGWSGAPGGTVSGSTGSAGGISFTSDLVSAGGVAAFTVNKVTVDGKEIDFAGDKSASIGI